MLKAEKQLNQEYRDIIGSPSPFWRDKSTESLKEALGARKRELRRGNIPSAKQVEARRAIRSLERELKARSSAGE